MHGIWVYDLETISGDDGNLECYAAGLINLELILRSPNMCKIIK